MAIFTSGFIFLAAGIIATIFFIGAPVFYKAPKNQTTIIRIIGISLAFAMFSSAAISIFSETYNTQSDNPGALFGSLFLTRVPGMSLCFFLQGLFIRSIRRSVLDLKVLRLFLVLLVLIGLGMYIFYPNSIQSEASFANVDLINSLYRSLGFLLLVAYIFYEIRKNSKIQEQFSIKILFALCGILILHTLLWSVFLVMDYINHQSFSSQVGGAVNLDLNVRYIRTSFFCISEVLLCIYWAENYSLNAIQESQKQEKIQQLLIEKDALIENLSNSSTLIESGALSAGLAHELNQFLARIELNRDEVFQLISQPGVKPEDLKLPLDNILKANNSAAKLIVSLKKLFNHGEEDYSLCSIDDLVREVSSLYKGRMQKSQIQMTVDLQASGQQYIWESLFRQVVVNLLSNAIEALDTSFQSNKMIQINSSLEKNGDYRLVITDNGPGISNQQGAKIFTLFATSKSAGNGIGLWLSHHIIERHQGSLSYQNLPDKGGVSFIITIPPGTKRNWAKVI
jgi:signal transduction histidine kinase